MAAGALCCALLALEAQRAVPLAARRLVESAHPTTHPTPTSRSAQHPYPHPHPLPAPHRYNLFFGFNGCSQQMFSLSINGTAEVLDMQVCPLGTHEADWERVSVLACKAGGAVKQVRCCALGVSVRAFQAVSQR